MTGATVGAATDQSSPDVGPSPRISLIAAVARNFVIGRDNALPWRLPADLAHFKRLTLDKPILMGRRTFESLPGLLPRRQHIVLSRDPDFHPAGAVVVGTPAEGIQQAADQRELMIIGGASIYRAFLPMASRMYLTWVDADIDGDASFPRWAVAEWREIERMHRAADERNDYRLTFVTLERNLVTDGEFVARKP